ncbi:hypothetical protein T492DRAFT_988624 [Pavlovales sp. CCMP2436]|nr:hypothetical protein T492DRAFT_988624 [Pavlovales sp. CCMP2436]
MPTADERAERRRARAAFLLRAQGSVEQYVHRQQSALSRQPAAEAVDPSELAECTFRPKLLPAAQARRARTANEMVYGDAMHRKLEHLELAEQYRAQEQASLRSAPLLTPVPGVEGVEGLLRLHSEPGSFVERMRERACLKQELIQSVREANVRAPAGRRPPAGLG